MSIGAGSELAQDDDSDPRAGCRRAGTPLIQPLSKRETEILHLIATGLSNREIAGALFLSPRTVERHIANLYLKLNVHTKVEATAYVRAQQRD